MDMQNVIYAVAVLFIMGIVFAILLGVAAKVFAVEVDERIQIPILDNAVLNIRVKTWY